MSVIDDKTNIFNTIKAYTSMAEQKKPPPSTNLFPSVNNKQDAVAFMLDLLAAVVGSGAIQKTLGDVMTKFVDSVEPDLKTAVKTQSIQSNASNTVPTTPITVSASQVDIYGQFYSSPYDDVNGGSLLYSEGVSDFNNSSYNAINAPNTEIPYSNIIITYNDADATFTYKPVPSSPNENIGTFIKFLIDSMVIIDKKVFTTNVMNAIYGSITTKQNRTRQQIADALAANALIDKIINNDPNANITDPERVALQDTAQNLINGVSLLDVGCGILEASLPISGLTQLVSSTSGSTDGYAVTQAYLNAFNQSTKTTQDNAAAAENQQTIIDGFFTRVMKAIQNALAASITVTPQMRALLAITSSFSLGHPDLGSVESDFKKYDTFIRCNTNQAKALLNKFIFAIVKDALTAFLLPIAKKIIQEKINQYLITLKGLII